jgi:hypothetical protein
VASASLAIMAKIEQLYRNVVDGDDAYLAFIPIALPFDGEELRLAVDSPAGPEAARALAAAAEFAVLANYVPSVAPIWSQDGRVLWDVYREVLTRAKVAAPALSEAEAERLAAAQGLLRDAETGEATAAYQRYLDLQEAYLQARERFTSAKLTAENSDDAVVAAEWHATQERLQVDVDRALEEWRTRGGKAAIEDALATVARLSGLNLETRFADAIDRLDRAERTGLAAGTGTFFDTAYLPRGMFAPGAVWTKLVLDASEIESLTAAARETAPDLEEIAGTDDDFQIRRLSVEIGRAEVLRPWFDQELITSRAWRWRNDAEPLSDGSDPPDGSMPAYVTAMIFARNLEVELKPRSRSNRALVAGLQVGRPMVLGNIVLQQVASTEDATRVERLTSAKAGRQSHVAAALAARAAVPMASVRGGSGDTGASRAGRPTSSSAAPRVRPTAALTATFTRLSRSSLVSDAARTARPASRRSEPRAAASPAVRDHRSRSGTAGARSATSRARVRDHRSGPTAAGARSATPRSRVRDHRTGPDQPVVRDHRFGLGGRALADLLERTRATVRVPAERGDPSGIRGRVTTSNESGDGVQGVPDARVTVLEHDDGAVVQSVVTDAAGNYVTRLAPGRYRVEATCEGFEDFAGPAPVVVRPRRKTRSDVRLEPESGTDLTTERQAGIQLVAVLCRKLPKAPDPDPELTWD